MGVAGVRGCPVRTRRPVGDRRRRRGGPPEGRDPAVRAGARDRGPWRGAPSRHGWITEAQRSLAEACRRWGVEAGGFRAPRMPRGGVDVGADRLPRVALVSLPLLPARGRRRREAGAPLPRPAGHAQPSGGGTTPGRSIRRSTGPRDKGPGTAARPLPTRRGPGQLVRARAPTWACTSTGTSGPRPRWSRSAWATRASSASARPPGGGARGPTCCSSRATSSSSGARHDWPTTGCPRSSPTVATRGLGVGDGRFNVTVRQSGLADSS